MTRARATRLLQVPDLDVGPAARDPATDATATTIPKPPELTWWDWAVFLLHTAAEVEHALMTQYLYGAYSLADSDFAGPEVPPDAALRTAAWRTTITAIAREEMGHLLTEQNLLRFIGGPLNLEREDFPFRSVLYPFPLTLEPLSRTSLAKYVAAEMPADPDEADIPEIVARATGATGGMRPNRVGVLFDTLIDVFSDPAKLTDADLDPGSAADRQARPEDWFGFGRLIVRAVATRAEAVAALRAVGEQGEGAALPSVGEPLAHFHQFLRIYREFPETSDGEVPAWVPGRAVPTDPTTGPQPDGDPTVERNRISHPVTRTWAQLFDVRYRMLLVDLVHALSRPGPLVDDDGAPTPRGHLRDWAFLQMRGEGLSGMRGIARLLTTRPAKADPAPGDPACAGPPFELPYSLAIPDDEHSRWRLHLSLLDSSARLTEDLAAAGETGDLLDELTRVDAAARAVVESLLIA
ncbi:ferritin-like domain-containing protein [Modestobacter excelsi]|uniref:ferritin-like domain-containing protein n=1 Tax=Modestobacter excelsi TaxID=2213161 RepID=UPI00110CAA81|nr:ferritin-like domain-containing protein [Modestobacter excelsi]